MPATEDQWTLEGPRITDAALLAKVRASFEEASEVIVEHKFYRRARAPHRFVCQTFDQFSRYLETEVRAGDSIWTWSLMAVCTDDAALVHGKKPNANGETPTGGAY